MIIAVAGPYSAPTEDARRQNLARLDAAAAALARLGHTPIIGVHAALPVVDRLRLEGAERYRMIMEISCAALLGCEALLLVAESPGALREAAFFTERGLPIYQRLEEVPKVD